MPTRRSRLQLLFDLAQLTFRPDKQPTPQQLDVLKQALSRITLEELGVHGLLEDSSCSCSTSGSDGHCDSPAGSCTASSRQQSSATPCSAVRLGDRDSMDLTGMYDALPAGQEQPRPHITYVHIHEDSTLSLGIFHLPARARIPLHNHPGMTVMSRVLYGQMHVQSFDWLDPRAEGLTPREAVKVVDDVFCAADDPVVLFPSSGGNIHQFTAVTDCAVLDLMTPPYSTDDGRDCSYYRLVPGSRQHPLRGEVALLDAHDPPDDFVIEHAAYQGQPVQPVKQQQRQGVRLKPGGRGLALPGDHLSSSPHSSGSPRSSTPPPSSESNSPVNTANGLSSSATAAALAAQDVARGAAAALQGYA